MGRGNNWRGLMKVNRTKPRGNLGLYIKPDSAKDSVGTEGTKTSNHYNLRLAALRAKIADGSYHVPGPVVARSMIMTTLRSYSPEG